MYCKKCASKIPEGAGFCPKCGSRVEKEEKLTRETDANGYTPREPVYIDDNQYKPHKSPYTPPPLTTERRQPEKLSVGHYLGLMLLSLVPIVGLVLMFIWGFSHDVAPNKKNFARAVLILYAIFAVLLIAMLWVLLSAMIDFAAYHYFDPFIT